MGQSNRRKLKNYLILKDVQLKICIINFIHMLLVVMATLAAVVIPLYILLINSPTIEDQYHAAIFLILITEPIPIALGLVLLLFVVHQIIITHQFCGPIINFMNTFREIARGNLTRKVHLRRHDLLQREAAEINTMADNLSQMLGGMKQDHAALMLALENACANPRVGDAELQAALQKARDLQAGFDHFVIAPPPAERP